MQTMKTILRFALLLASTLLLCACESMGFNPAGIGEALTPGVDAETSVRTWDNATNPPTPVERQVENPPAFR